MSKESKIDLTVQELSDLYHAMKRDNTIQYFYEGRMREMVGELQEQIDHLKALAQAAREGEQQEAQQAANELIDTLLGSC